MALLRLHPAYREDDKGIVGQAELGDDGCPCLVAIAAGVELAQVDPPAG